MLPVPSSYRHDIWDDCETFAPQSFYRSQRKSHSIFHHDPKATATATGRGLLRRTNGSGGLHAPRPDPGVICHRTAPDIISTLLPAKIAHINVRLSCIFIPHLYPVYLELTVKISTTHIPRKFKSCLIRCGKSPTCTNFSDFVFEQ